MPNAELHPPGTDADSPPSDPPAAAREPRASAPGGSRELLKLALPLVVSQSFMTVQILADALLLSWHDPDELTASFPAVMWFWVLFALPQVTAGYTSTFVAQYTGAGRPRRVGPAVWQGVHFAVVAGLLFLLVRPLVPALIAAAGHPADVQGAEVVYLRCLCFAALPMLVVGAVNGFYSGRGKTWTVLAVEAVGTAVNVAVAQLLIFGRWGFPEMGIEGAGWATVAGSWASAAIALALFVRRRERAAFDTLGGWRPERELFARLMRYGGPAGVQWFLDALVFSLFTLYVGRLGKAELGATTLAVRFNMVAFLPMMGIGQAVGILVGQRLGADRPDLAEKATYTGLRWAFGYMLLVAAAYLLFPGALVSAFEPDGSKAGAEEAFAAIAAIVPALLTCVAIYSLTDAVNVTFSFALRGAGDTRFVTLLTFLLAWPVMVLPTVAVVSYRDELGAAYPGMGDPVYWAWGFATAHIMAMSCCFAYRFRSGKWKAMRVIEGKGPDEVSHG